MRVWACSFLLDLHRDVEQVEVFSLVTKGLSILLSYVDIETRSRFSILRSGNDYMRISAQYHLFGHRRSKI